MANTTISPNMSLVVPTVGVDPGPNWANDLNASLSILDQHNHSLGSGVQIQPSGLNINSSLSFQNQQATGLQAAVFTPQSSLATLDALYVKGVDLYYNDGSSNVIQMTAGGVVNATSSGISSGTASASFVSSVLVVNAASTTPADIQCGSIFLGNNSAGSKFLKLSTPNAMASNFTLVLPNIPAAQQFMSIDASGNIAGYANVSGGITGSNLAALTIATGNIADGAITTAKILDQNVTAAKIANGTITGTQLDSNINLPGTLAQVGALGIITSSTNAAAGLKVIRGTIQNGDGVVGGEGFTPSNNTTYSHIVFSSAFSDIPVVVVSDTSPAGSGAPQSWSVIAVNSGGVDIGNLNAVTSGTVFSFIAIGRR